tara:strand:+ start:287 stop:751 length:465 start_codon:yes stop_codon:yes gene_type:complete
MATFDLDILIVEDNHTYRALILSAFKEHNCRTATTYQEGVDLYNSRKPHISFLDINLPDGNGLDLLKIITDDDPQAYCIILTGSAAPEDVSRAQTYGAMEYILKPFTATRIQETLDHFEIYRNKLIEIACDEDEIELSLAKKFAHSKQKIDKQP